MTASFKFQVSCFKLRSVSSKFHVRPHNLKLETLNLKLKPLKAQASIEMTVAMFGTLLLLLGCFKVFLWVNTRLIQRQQAYEATRLQAGTSTSTDPVRWQEPSERLRIFNE